MTSPVEPEFNPAYRIARCGDSSPHGPHVMEHGPDQPRNCPGTGIVFWGKPDHVPWCRCRGTGSVVVRDSRCTPPPALAKAAGA